MPMHPSSGQAEDFLGVGPWMDDQVDGGSFLHAPMDPAMPIISKPHNPYSSMQMQNNMGMMMYGAVSEPQPQYVDCVLLFLLSFGPSCAACRRYTFGGYDGSHSFSGGPSSPSAISHSLHDTSSSSSPASPASPPPPATPNSPLSIELLHKPRGSAGQWRSIVGKQRVRVTHGRGKNMRMVVRSLFEPDWSTFKLILMEKEENWADAPAELWSIETQRPLEEAMPDGSNVWVLQIDLKLYAIHKVVAFRASVVPAADRSSLITANSSVMSTHNSGRRDVRGKGGDEDEDDMDDQEEEAPRKEKRSKRDSPEHASKLQESHAYPDALPPAKQAKTQTIQTPSAGRQSIQSVTRPQTAAYPPQQQTSGYPYQQQAEYAQAAPQQQQHAQMPPDPSTQPWQTVAGNLQVDGVVRARAFLQYSDMRLKTDITEITDALNIICKLKGKTYKWKKDVENPAAGQTGGQRVIGLIAQEVQKVLPEVVKETHDGWLSVNYVEIIPVLVEAFKQHTRDFDQFKGGVETNIRDMKEDMAALTTLTAKLQEHQGLPDSTVLSELEGMSQHVARMQEILKARRAVLSGPESPSDPLRAGPESSDLAASGVENSTSSSVSTSSSGDASDGSQSRLVKLNQASSPTASIPASKEAVNLHVHVTSKDNTWKFIAGALAVVILLGAIVGIVLGVRSSPVAPPPVALWSKNELNNSGFEVPDPEAPGKALAWGGTYQLLIFDPIKKRAADPVPCNDSSPLDCWDTVTIADYKSVSDLRPEFGSTILMLNVPSNATTVPAWAFQVAGPEKSPGQLPAPGDITMVNVTAKAFGQFVTRSLPRNSTFTNAAFELDVIVKYQGLGKTDLTRMLFNARQAGWQSGYVLVPIKSQYSVEYVHIQLWQTAVGSSFWDDIELSYLGR